MTCDLVLVSPFKSIQINLSSEMNEENSPSPATSPLVQSDPRDHVTPNRPKQHEAETTAAAFTNISTTTTDSSSPTGTNTANVQHPSKNPVNDEGSVGGETKERDECVAGQEAKAGSADASMREVMRNAAKLTQDVTDSKNRPGMNDAADVDKNVQQSNDRSADVVDQPLSCTQSKSKDSNSPAQDDDHHHKGVTHNESVDPIQPQEAEESTDATVQQHKSTPASNSTTGNESDETVVSPSSLTADPVVVSPKRVFSTADFYKLMRSERNRLDTFLFNNWNCPHVSAHALAKCGFFYLLSEDKVQCAFCKIVIWGWESDVEPVREHLRHNPRCRFLSGCDVGNVPIDIGPLQLIERSLGVLDVCGTVPVGRASDPVQKIIQDLSPQDEQVDELPCEVDDMTLEEEEVTTIQPIQSNRTLMMTNTITAPKLQMVSFDSVSDLEDDEMIEAEEFNPILVHQDKKPAPTAAAQAIANNNKQPKNTSAPCSSNRQQMLKLMHNEVERLKTFANIRHHWPLTFVRPKDLARAGFFYTFTRDKVQCAFCETFVWDWEPGDHPIREHLRHNSRCPYLTGQALDNVPIDASEVKRVVAFAQNVTCDDVCPVSSAGSSDEMNDSILFEQDPTAFYSRPIQPLVSPTSATNQLQNLRFVTFDARKASFDRWPLDAKISSVAAAQAGFYYTGEFGENLID